MSRGGLVERRRPAREEVERVFRCGAGLGGICRDPQACVRGKVHRLERQGQVADDRVMEALYPGAMEAHVVRGPPGAEGLAAGRQLPNQAGQCLVVRVASGLRSQQRDRVLGLAFPLDVELCRPGVEEDKPGGVRGLGRAGEDWREERFAEPVRGENVQASVPHVGRRGGH